MRSGVDTILKENCCRKINRKVIWYYFVLFFVRLGWEGLSDGFLCFPTAICGYWIKLHLQMQGVELRVAPEFGAFPRTKVYTCHETGELLEGSGWFSCYS